jgi:hypothetical protein
MRLTGPNKITFAILLTIGFAFCAGALVAATNTLLFLHRATLTQARFVGAVDHVGGNHGGSFLCPQFVFHTPDNRAVTYTSTNCSTAQPYADNQTVPILYDPANPGAARLDTFFNLWTTTLVFAPFALGFLGIPLLVLLSVRRQTSR